MRVIWLSLVMMTLLGCTTVQPYHREILAKPSMQFDVDTVENGAREHFLNSIEGSSGGFGISGGGCGCN